MEQLLLLLQMMLINVVLSGDNAVVIAMACKDLPSHQRNIAVWWGTLGAIIARVILTIIAIKLLGIPYIQVIGAILLLWMAIGLLNDQDSLSSVKQASSLRNAIGIIVVADVIMSLDNVLAIAAKGQGNITLTVIGVALSIPMIVFGSQMMMKLLKRFPILVYLGAALLGYTAGEMFLQDQKVIHNILEPHEYLHWVIPIFTTLLVVAWGYLAKIAKKKS
jgi:YjbE family integral membrane protein